MSAIDESSDNLVKQWKIKKLIKDLMNAKGSKLNLN